MSDDPQVAEFLDQYDDLACSVVGDQRPNINVGIEYSNAELVEEVCELMGWEDFDLMAPYDFEEAYNSGDRSTILAHLYINHLRLDLFFSANVHDIGDTLVNTHAIAFSDYWFRKLRDQLYALDASTVVKHGWLH